MSLKIVSGRAGSGKTSFMLDDMADVSDAIYLVPEQYSFSAEKKIIERFGMCGLGCPEVMSFRKLARKIVSESGAGSGIISDNAVREMLISFCTSDLPPEKMRLFDGLVRKNMLAPTASGLITTFRRYNITAEMLEKACAATDNPVLEKKLADCKTILEAYNARLAECGASDPEDIITLAAELADGSTVFDGKSIYIDQFSDFDPQQYVFIGKMLEKAQRVCVGLCLDDGEPFPPARRTHDALVRLAEKLGTAVEAEEYVTGAMKTASPMLACLEKMYFSEQTPPFAGTDGSIRIFCGKTMAAEIHDAARRIVALVRDEGCRFRDISVVARNIDDYKCFIERIFPIYGIPVFIDRKTPLSGHAVTLFVTSILDLAIGGFTYENIFRYIKSPFSPLEQTEADILENYCLAGGIRPYMWKKPFKYAKNDAELEQMNALRERAAIPVSELAEKLRKRHTVREICALLGEFFETVGLEEKILKYADMLASDGENVYALQTKQVYNLLTEILSSLCEIAGDKTTDIKTFYAALNTGLSAVEIGTIPSASDCVSVGSIDRIKGHGARAVFLIGVNSGKFPAPAADNGIFSESDKQELETLGIELPPGMLAKAESEQLLIYDALTCADKKLNVSYAIADSSGGALLCSEIVTRIHALFPDIEYDDNITKEKYGDESVASRREAFELLAAALRGAMHGEPLPHELSAAGAYFEKDALFAPLLKSMLGFAEYANEPQKIEPELAARAFGGEMKTSVSQLELYNNCPFSYFAKYVLKLRPREVFEINNADSGSFLHDFLNLFSEKVASAYDAGGEKLSWNAIDDAFIKENTDLILKQSLSAVNGSALEIPRIKALYNRLRRVALKCVYAVRSHIVNGDFVPLGYEISFDDDGSFAPMRLTLSDGKRITLRGRIDRADVFSPDGKNTFARIVDYKSSDRALKLDDVYHGLSLQLFVYLSNLCENGYKPAGILYCNLSDPIIEAPFGTDREEITRMHTERRRMSGIVLAENDMRLHMGGDETLSGKKQATYKNFNSMFRHLKKVIAKTAEKISGGEFPLERTEDACDRCDYAAVCRFDGRFGGCRVKTFEKIKDEEIWQRTEAEENAVD